MEVFVDRREDDQSRTKPACQSLESIYKKHGAIHTFVQPVKHVTQTDGVIEKVAFDVYGHV